MFTSTVAAGERVALWSPGGVEPEPRLRVLLPGEGESARAQAASAVFVPSVQQASRPGRTTKGSRRRAKGAGVIGGPGRTTTGRRSVVLPDDPSPMDTARRAFLGHRGGAGHRNRPGHRPPARGDARGHRGRARVDRTGLLADPRRRSATRTGPGRRAGPPPRPVGPRAADRPGRGARHRGRPPATPNCPSGSSPGGPTPCWNRSPPATGCCPGCRPSNTPTWRCCPGTTPGWPRCCPPRSRSPCGPANPPPGTRSPPPARSPPGCPAPCTPCSAGLIDADHAIAVARATGTTTAEVAAQVENDLLPEVTQPRQQHHRRTTPPQSRPPGHHPRPRRRRRPAPHRRERPAHDPVGRRRRDGRARR